jgi:hypothetical protein
VYDFFSCLVFLNLLVTAIIHLLIVQVIDHFTGRFRVVVLTDVHRQLALLRLHYHRLTAHAANHVERLPGFAAQCKFEDVVLDPAFDHPLHLMGHFEEAIRRA